MVNDFVDTEKITVGPYKYDKLEPVRRCHRPRRMGCWWPPPDDRRRPGAARHREAEPLHTRSGAARARRGAPRRALEAGGENNRVYLVLQNLQAQAQPGILYNVYLDPPSGAPSSPPDAPVGTINFFGAGGHAADHGAARGQSTRYSFDVTDAVKAASDTAARRRYGSHRSEHRRPTRVRWSGQSALSGNRCARRHAAADCKSGRTSWPPNGRPSPRAINPHAEARASGSRFAAVCGAAPAPEELDGCVGLAKADAGARRPSCRSSTRYEATGRS